MSTNTMQIYQIYHVCHYWVASCMRRQKVTANRTYVRRFPHLQV